MDGIGRPVAFDVPAPDDARLTRAIDDAYGHKYGALGAMSDRMREATVRIAPLESGPGHGTGVSGESNHTRSS
ncbi:hypothetical protein [Streptomyces sp. NPDC051662]|uniref:hypothetical protein n=1 Tax=Streptomyces sp. NPDC051662 TaxID=3154750 RepID=UPI0034338641